MSPQNPFDDPKLVTELAQTFESIWLVMRAHEPLVDADRAKELSIEISRKLVELAADGVTDPAQLRRLTLESLPLSPASMRPSALQAHRNVEPVGQRRNC
jgi:hypothetical protein